MLKQNPNTRRFQNHMAKVIASVKHRTNRLDHQSSQLPETSAIKLLPESQRGSNQLVPDFSATRPIIDGSMLLSGHSSAKGSEMMPGGGIHQSMTSANIRASARREIGLSGDLSGGGTIMRHKTQSNAFSIGTNNAK